MAQVLLVAVAVEQALLITLANRTLYDTNGQIRANEVAATYDGLDRATWQAPFWADPAIRRDPPLRSVRYCSKRCTRQWCWCSSAWYKLLNGKERLGEVPEPIDLPLERLEAELADLAVGTRKLS